MTEAKAGLVSIGGLVVALGIVWMSIVFPGYERLPDDFSRVTEYNGSYTVVDPIVARVQGNAAIQRLRSDPTGLQTIADPRTQGFLAGPGLSQLLADEAVRGLLADPEKLRQMVANPQALAKAVDPALIPVLTDPAVASLLGDAAIVTVLTDAEAMELVLDPRTLALLADPTELPLVTIPVKVRTARLATHRDGEAIFIRETGETTIIDPDTRQDTGVEAPGFPRSELLLALNAKTREYLPETEGDRTGPISFPFSVKADKTYPIFVAAARQPLEATYVRSEKRDGLRVMVFQISAQDRPMGAHPALGLPLVVDSEITLWVEPRSGSVVDAEDRTTTVSVVRPDEVKRPVFVSELKLTEATVRNQIAAAKNNRAQLYLYGSYVPWGMIAVGTLVAAAGVLFVGRRRKRQGDGRDSADLRAEPAGA